MSIYMKRYIPLLALAITTQLHAATIVTGNFAAAFDNGFATQNGTALPVGNEVRLGSFNISDAQIVQMINNGDLVGLSSHFTLFSAAFIGTDAFPGHLGQIPLNQRGGLFEKSTTMDLPLALANADMYMWVFKTTGDNAVAGDFSNVLQIGVFSNNNAAWRFPADTGLPESRSIELTNLTDASGDNLSGTAKVVFGSFGTGTIPATGAKAFDLSPVVPEPSAATVVLTSVGLLALRRRRRS
jgi:hypothetical protein